MTLADLSSLGSFISGIAVLISLVYLSLQVRQAERNQQALIRQGRTERIVAMSIAALEPTVADAITKAMVGSDDLSRTEFAQFMQSCIANMRSVEDSFYQHKEGLLNESAFDSLIVSVKGAFSMPGMRVAWQQQRFMYQTEFAEFIDKVIAETPVQPLLDGYEIFKAGVRAEREKTQI